MVYFLFDLLAKYMQKGHMRSFKYPNTVENYLAQHNPPIFIKFNVRLLLHHFLIAFCSSVK